MTVGSPSPHADRKIQRPLKVCLAVLFLQDHLGGIGMVTLHLAEALQALHPDWEMTVFTHAGVAPHLDKPGRRFHLKTIPKWSLWIRLLYWHFFFPWISRRYDLVHSLGNLGFIIPGAPQVIHIHDTYEQISRDRFPWHKRWLMSLAIRISGTWAKSIVAVSENTAKDIRRFYPNLAPKTRVILSGRKFPLIEMGWPESGAYYVFLGTLEPGKRINDILAALAKIPESQRQPLWIIGAQGWTRGNPMDAHPEWANVQPWVRFMGYRTDDEIIEYLRKATALIMPSSYEGFGLPIIEAMACGCPVIAAANSGMLEAGGNAALFFPTGDTQKLAEAMQALASQGNLRQVCIQKGLAHVRSMTWENTAKQISVEYLRVVNS